MSGKRWHAVIDRMPKNRQIYGAEVGVWDGRMSEQLLRELDNLILVCVDRWEPPGVYDTYYDSGSTIARSSKDAYIKAYNTYRARTEPFRDRIGEYIGDSVSGTTIASERSLDFVFLDGDHSYAGVTRDIIAWYNKVKIGGYIGGHDYGHPEQGQVEQAVLDYFADFPGVIELDRNRTWFYRREE